MAMEIINVEELSQIATATPYEPRHRPLIAALQNRYPQSTFHLLCSQDQWSRPESSVVDAGGNQVAEDYKKWLTAEFHTAGDDAQALYKRYKDSGMRIVETEGDTVVIAAPYGQDPDAFLQIQIGAVRKKAELLLFSHSWEQPKALRDLLYPSEYGDAIELSPWSYQVQKMVNVRRFVRDMVELDRARRLAELPEKEKERLRVLQVEDGEPWIREIPFLELYPDFLAQPMKELRFLVDWQESSANRGGNRLCNHWWLEFKDYVYQGQRYMSFTPQWAEADGGLNLPEVEASGSIFSLMDALEKFDREASYPFAWFFYMVHGNRMGRNVGEKVLEGLKTGKIGLPENDKEVLLRWGEHPYGF
jgi:hypothetical protein